MNKTRISIRLTEKMLTEINKLMETGKYLNKSNLIRELIWIGLNGKKEE